MHRTASQAFILVMVIIFAWASFGEAVLAGPKKANQDIPIEFFDMYHDKAPALEGAESPDSIPYVESIGTRPQSTQEAIQAKSLVDFEDSMASDCDQWATPVTSESEFLRIESLSSEPPYFSYYDGCTSSSRIVCAYDHVYRFFYLDFITSSNTTTVEVSTSNLAQVYDPVPNPDSWPDTLIYLLKCSDDNCTSGKDRKSVV
mgnify:CR=1 FL=1